MIAKAEDAATIILLRNSAGNNPRDFEVLMVRRHERSRFVPDAYVFPGGRMETSDCSTDMARFCRGVSPQDACRILKNSKSPEKALGLWIAGIRETFEEVGILIARRKNGELFLPLSPSETARFHNHRQNLISGIRHLSDILEEEELYLPLDELHYFSHWITPAFFPIRYNTRFFLCRMPTGQEAIHDGVELTDHVWRSPRDILADYRRGQFDMVLPTAKTIKSLCHFESVEEAIKSAARFGNTNAGSPRSPEVA